jgi:hypothetical protein
MTTAVKPIAQESEAQRDSISCIATALKKEQCCSPDPAKYRLSPHRSRSTPRVGERKRKKEQNLEPELQ